MLTLWFAFAAPAAPDPQKKADPAKPKQDPRAKLAAPWPNADELQRRRERAEGLRLFQNSDPLAFTLTADFKALNEDRDPDSAKRFPAVLSVAGEGGEARSIPVTLRTRGRTRLKYHCGFVPILIEFPKRQAKGTAFEGQEDLKLGTHCHGSKEYEQYALREYLAYRILNLLTPRSFRVRLAKAAYVDSNGGEAQADRPAMFLEAETDLARRLEGRIAPLPRTPFAHLEPEALMQMMLFEYMIGNTDFSIIALHNVRLVLDSRNVLYPIPYDFDYSGLVDAPYAAPSHLLKLTTVRERLYRGPCRTLEELQPIVERFREKRPAVMTLLDSVPGLDSGSRRHARRYLEEFYEGIESPGAVKRALVDGCWERPGM
jgi:hypothetical protein